MNTIDQLLEQAQSLFKAGKLEKAREIFADVHARAPDQGVALQGLAYVAANRMLSTRRSNTSCRRRSSSLKRLSSTFI